MTKIIERVSQEQVQAVLAAARRAFPIDNHYGVLGFVIAPKRKAGRALRHNTLRVYVAAKERAPRNLIGPLEFRSRRQKFSIQPDVVGVGACATHPRHLTRANFSGLHPGAAIRVDRAIGATSLLLAPPGTARPTHLLTAGHLFEPGGERSVLAAADRHSQRIQIGVLEINLLDTTSEKDGALVKLNQPGQDMALATKPPESAGDPEGVLPDAAGVIVPRSRMYRPTAGDATDSVRPIRRQGVIFLPDDRRGRIPIESPLVCSSLGEAGDSGALLRSVDDKSLAVGSYSGVLGIEAVFEWIDGLMDQMRQQGAPLLRIWRP
jgi:hypothetical protein